LLDWEIIGCVSILIVVGIGCAVGTLGGGGAGGLGNTHDLNVVNRDG